MLKSKLWAPLSGIGPGLFASAIVAGAAGLLATWTSGPIMLFALLLGIAVNFLGKIDRFNGGISFTSKFVLRLGVALLGLKITLGDVISLGWAPLLLVVAAISLTILSATAVARWMGFDPRFGVLSGGATAICGASAAMALSAALPNHPNKERATLYTVVGVSTLSTIAMLLYPAIVRILGLDSQHAWEPLPTTSGYGRSSSRQSFLGVPSFPSSAGRPACPCSSPSSVPRSRPRPARSRDPRTGVRSTCFRLFDKGPSIRRA